MAPIGRGVMARLELLMLVTKQCGGAESSKCGHAVIGKATRVSTYCRPIGLQGLVISIIYGCLRMMTVYVFTRHESAGKTFRPAIIEIHQCIPL